MKRIDMGGVSVTEIALGAGKRGTGADEDVFRVMDRYVELGGNCFDSARMYAGGASDKALGRWLKSRGCRESVVICAKGGFPADKDAMHISRLSPGEIEADLDDALRDMGVERVDLFLLHRDDVKKPVAEIVPALDALVKKGKTRAVGCSNWTAGRIATALAFARENGLAPMAVCQMHHSLAVTTAAQTGDVTHVPMSDVEFGWYRETRFPVMGFGVQGRGYFARLASGEKQSESAKRYYDVFPENHRRAARLEALSRELGASRAAVLVAYILRGGLNEAALCAFSSVSQLEDAFAGARLCLTDAQVRYLNGADGENC